MLFLLEGMDKTGKSTVAELLRRKYKCDYMHMSVPAKFHTRESYFAEMLHLIAHTAGKNFVIDRTWYGELVWPHIYGRNPLLANMDVNALTDAANILHKGEVRLIYMHDPNVDAHLARLKAYKEPSYNYEKTLEQYGKVAFDHNFEFLTFQEATHKWT